MTWNYRVVKRTSEEILRMAGDTEREITYSIHEAYYGTVDKADSITTEPVYPSGESIKELKDDLELYTKALDKPVLNWEDF